jgi:hypothetical protein
MQGPLSREQEALRGRKLADLTDAQLERWIEACDTMERWVTASKARRSWKESRKKAMAEIAKRRARAAASTRRGS